jgi:hypothetical protein
MPTWIVLRQPPPGEPGRDAAPTVLGSVSAERELDARLVAHARWMTRPEVRLRLLPQDEATPADRAAATRAHIDLAEDGRRLDDVFADRLVP